MKIEVVVARYNESIDWLKGLEPKVTIYNKGTDSIPNSIKLPNVGRESHTYFHHIVNNYDRLSSWTFFTQAHPFDHVRNMDKIIQDFPEIIEGSTKIKLGSKGYFFTNGAFNRVLTSDSRGLPFHAPELNIDELYSTLFVNETPPKVYEFTAGCIFCVSKDLILKRPKEFYVKCLEISETREMAPWEFERMMQYIFK